MTQLPDVVSENTPLTSPSRLMEDNNTVCIYTLCICFNHLLVIALHRMYILTPPYQQPVVLQNNYKIVIYYIVIISYNKLY